MFLSSIMELIKFVSSLSTTTSFALFFVFLLSIIKLGSSSKDTSLPPGPWKLPIIGSLHHLSAGSLPHHTLSKLSKTYGPLMHLKLGQISTYIVSSPLAAKSAMKTHDIALADRITTLAIDILSYNLSGIVFTPYGEHWRQVRKICIIRLLSNKKVKSFQSVREQEVTNLIASIGRSVGSPVNLSAKIFALSSSITCRTIFGEKLDCQDSLLELVIEAATLIGGFNFADFFPSLHILAVISGMRSKALNVHNKIDKLLGEIIKKRRDQYYDNNNKGEQEAESILDVLLRLQQRNELDFPITDNTIKAVILDLFAGGADTSASTIEWAMSEMIKNPRVMRKAQSELRLSHNGKTNMDEIVTYIRPTYLNLVIKETLRLHPPIPLKLSKCREACEINGYGIPDKATVFINIWAIGRDPNFWTEAESFIPERFENHKVEFNGTNYEYIPFGGGRRLCPGISFGLAVVEQALTQLLYHFDWKLPNGLKPEALDMDETFGVAASKENHLYLIANLNGTDYTK